MSSDDSSARIDLRYAGQRLVVQTWQIAETVHIFSPLGATQITEIDALAHAGETHAEAGRLTAPMPGKSSPSQCKRAMWSKKAKPWP